MTQVLPVSLTIAWRSPGVQELASFALSLLHVGRRHLQTRFERGSAHCPCWWNGCGAGSLDGHMRRSDAGAWTAHVRSKCACLLAPSLDGRSGECDDQRDEPEESGIWPEIQARPGRG